jgi:imidazole glycerol-phosphate synthase subunit HisH
MGNLRSVEKALARAGAEAEVTRDQDRIRAADGLVLPGVGAFPKAMRAVRELGFDELIPEQLDGGKPVLGICLGMQLLFDRSDELGGAEGLGLIPGPVRPLDAGALKVPHIGWNAVSFRGQTALNDGLPAVCAFYHVHSFAPMPAREEDVTGTAEYGAEFASVVARGKVHGVQFHPEKSGPDGLRLLGNFAALCAPARAAA